MKKTYIIPATEVVEIKISQLIMTSQMRVLDGELESGEILSRGTKGDFWDDEEDEEDYY
jgi:hypothetical protein